MYLFTSESVCRGHPDKVCDQISDAILDACLKEDPFSRVACQTLFSKGLLVLAGEITSTAPINYQEIALHTIRSIGYEDPQEIKIAIHKQSPDIARGIGKKLDSTLGAGDQGLMFGYACEETKELMPLPIMLAHALVAAVPGYKKYIQPDGKAQVTLEYDRQGKPVHLHTIVLSLQHKEEVSEEELAHDLKELIYKTMPKDLIDERTHLFINPTGRFVLGGPHADTGLTGRKTAVDTYGGAAHHGGGAFSGKDPTKVDRSGAYAARYVAKNIVAAKLASRCEVQISYAIGVAYPISIRVDTFGTATLPEEKIVQAVQDTFDLTPGGILKTLDLLKPIYQKTAYFGHFGREEFSWEKLDKIDLLRN